MEEETNNSLVGVISNNQEILGTITGEGTLQATINPITTKLINNYEDLKNKPQINEVMLIHNKSLEDLNVTKLTNIEIENIINSIV